MNRLNWFMVHIFKSVYSTGAGVPTWWILHKTDCADCWAVHLLSERFEHPSCTVHISGCWCFISVLQYTFPTYVKQSWACDNFIAYRQATMHRNASIYWGFFATLKSAKYFNLRVKIKCDRVCSGNVTADTFCLTFKTVSDFRVGPALTVARPNCYL